MQAPDHTAQSHTHDTQFHHAAGYGRPELVAMLLSAGATTTQLKLTRTIHNAHHAAGYGRPDLVAMLLDAGADAAAKNVNGKTAADLT